MLDDFSAPSMDALGLDARVARAAAKRGYAAPTAVQAQAIPLALAGKARARKLSALWRRPTAPRRRTGSLRCLRRSINHLSGHTPRC